MDLVATSSIRDLRTNALLGLIERLKALDLSTILVYRIPSLVDSAALTMAWQWDVLNPLLAAGYSVDPSAPTTPAQYKALIQNSTALHRKVGTPGAMKQAFANLGFPNAQIMEGQDSWGGTSWPSDQGWAVFRVSIDLSTMTHPADAATQRLLVGIANYWKPERCWLDGVTFTSSLTCDLRPSPTDFITSAFGLVDTLKPSPTDSLDSLGWALVDAKPIVPLHNKRYYHAGTTYGTSEPHVADSGLIINGEPVT